MERQASSSSFAPITYKENKKDMTKKQQRPHRSFFYRLRAKIRIVLQRCRKIFYGYPCLVGKQKAFSFFASRPSLLHISPPPPPARTPTPASPEWHQQGRLFAHQPNEHWRIVGMLLPMLPTNVWVCEKCISQTLVHSFSSFSAAPLA